MLYRNSFWGSRNIRLQAIAILNMWMRFIRIELVVTLHLVLS